jgi:hypothetical protein
MTNLDIAHITRLRERIEDAQDRIEALEARGQYHMTREQAEALDRDLDDARFDLALAERVLLDDYGLTYQDGVPWRPEPIKTVVNYEVVQRFLEGAGA